MTQKAVVNVTLRQAARLAGISLLVMAVLASFVEIYIYPTLIVPDSMEQTVQNIEANQGLFLVGIFCYLFTYIGDILVAWAFYVLFRPGYPSLALLAAWFRLVHAVLALVALLHLVTVQRALSNPDYLAAFGTGPFHAQVMLLINSFRYEWGISLIFFGIHLGWACSGTSSTSPGMSPRSWVYCWGSPEPATSSTT
jgi:hypothetical protein